MGENTCRNFWEFLGIPNNSNFKGELEFQLLEFVGVFKNPKKIGIYGNSWEFQKIPEKLSQFGLTTNFYF